MMDDEVTLLWPVRPACHDQDPHAQTFEPTRWERRAEGYRHCNYCGSLHPEDLHKVLLAGARLGGSDWKVGWPNKFYVYDAPSANVGLFDREPPKVAMLKWYNTHLYDLDAVAFSVMSDLLMKHSNIRFERDAGGMRFFAPYVGYQKL